LAVRYGADYGLPREFWKHDIANTDDLALAVKVLMPLGNKGVEKAIEKVGVCSVTAISKRMLMEGKSLDK
jgi:hypothetical protein